LLSVTALRVTMIKNISGESVSRTRMGGYGMQEYIVYT